LLCSIKSFGFMQTAVSCTSLFSINTQFHTLYLFWEKKCMLGTDENHELICLTSKCKLSCSFTVCCAQDYWKVILIIKLLLKYLFWQITPWLLHIKVYSLMGELIDWLKTANQAAAEVDNLIKTHRLTLGFTVLYLPLFCRLC